MNNRKATPEEATQVFLDRLKQSNPSTEVRAAIDEIEGELRQPKLRHRPKKKQTREERTLASSGR